MNTLLLILIVLVAIFFVFSSMISIILPTEGSRFAARQSGQPVLSGAGCLVVIVGMVLVILFVSLL